MKYEINKTLSIKDELLRVSSDSEKLLKKSKTEKEFLEQYFNMICPETFYSVNNSLQCKSYARRSFGDLYNLLRNYFPKITKAKLCYLLISSDKISWLYCADVKNWVFSIGRGSIFYTDVIKSLYKTKKELTIENIYTKSMEGGVDVDHTYNFLTQRGIQNYSMETILITAIQYFKQHDKK